MKKNNTLLNEPKEKLDNKTLKDSKTSSLKQSLNSSAKTLKNNINIQQKTNFKSNEFKNLFIKDSIDDNKRVSNRKKTEIPNNFRRKNIKIDDNNTFRAQSRKNTKVDGYNTLRGQSRKTTKIDDNNSLRGQSRKNTKIDDICYISF